ncbi:MAG TPA: outer membrane lipoprotein-sorting protein [Myxococcales bacterium]|jgi:outer membrane lipoprotein-sorting protein
MKRSAVRTALCAAFALTCLSSAASAGEVDDILAKVDKAQSPGKDQVGVMKMTIKDKGGNAKVRQLAIKQMGTDFRLVRFQSPAEVKGVCFLSRGENEMYIFMPDFGKVRRIASHTKTESFMGSDFSYDDMGSGKMTDKYDGKIAKKEGDLVTIELTPKKGADSDVKRRVLVVDTRYFIAVRGENYDANDKLVKETVQEDIKQASGNWIAGRITAKNLREGSSTVLEMSETRFDTGLKEDDFSQRNMKRSD